MIISELSGSELTHIANESVPIDVHIPSGLFEGGFQSFLLSPLKVLVLRHGLHCSQSLFMWNGTCFQFLKLSNLLWGSVPTDGKQLETRFRPPKNPLLI